MREELTEGKRCTWSGVNTEGKLAELGFESPFKDFLSPGHFKPETKAEPGTLEGAKACGLKREL